MCLIVLIYLLSVWQVVDAPEILTVIGKIPHLSEFLNSLYDCQYKSFFSAFGKHACVSCFFLLFGVFLVMFINLFIFMCTIHTSMG